jgi:CBS domain-containing protein
MTASGPPAAASQRFLDAFNAIEQYLRRHFGQRDKGWEPFVALLRRATEKSPPIRQFEADLEDYADLRNAIVHRSRGDQVIAEPHLSAVQRLERIRDRLLSPPAVHDHFRIEVVTAAPDQRVGEVAMLMRRGDFSQVPVYAAGSFVALLTAETITRWLAAGLAKDDGFLIDAPVADVLPHTEDPNNYVLLGRKATAFDALEEFRKFTERGASLDAILLTHSGQPTERPLGILTVFDIPKLLGLIAPSAT